MNSFFKGVAKVASAIVLAALALAVIAYGISEVREGMQKREAKPFEEVKAWTPELHEALGLKLRARTKVVDGMLHADLNFYGYPPYLSLPQMREKNAARQFTVEFRDADGFKLFEKAVAVQDFTTILGPDGKPAGLKYEFTQFVALEDYRRWSRAQVGWNVDTDEPKEGVGRDTPVIRSVLDHCATGLSRSERLKRLAQHGTVREIGTGHYESGGRTVAFHYDGDLMSCR